MLMRLAALSSNGSSRTYATYDPSNKAAVITLSNGNLTEVGSQSGGDFVRSTIGKSSGKHYAEFTITTVGQAVIGIVNGSANPEKYAGFDNNGYGYYEGDGKIYHTTATAYGATFTSGDKIGLALDMDSIGGGFLTFYKNGVSQGAAVGGLTGTWYFASGSGASGTLSITANFGQSSFTYAEPSGFNPGLYT